jgi:transposase-like protein
VDRATLEAAVERGLTVRAIAVELGCSPKTVAKWLRHHGLRTERGRRRGLAATERAQLRCPIHGETAFIRRGDSGWRCLRCRSEAVTLRRRRMKEILVAEAGGRCALCGYDRYVGALQFHHLEPGRKRFSLADAGLTRSLAKAREEAGKCALVCANCHAELEAGRASMSYSSTGGPG